MRAAMRRIPTSHAAAWISWWWRFAAPSSVSASAHGDARALRRQADALVRADPHLATELRAAADRHEQLHGD